MPADRSWLAAAIALSWRGRGRTSPNPNVGCIILDENGRVAGRGWTQPGGRPHAEAMALTEAGATARGGTAYVSLEPCAHRSARGPCCASLLMEADLRRVVIAATDPDPRTQGRGIARLREAGMDVHSGALEFEAQAAMAGFFTRHVLGRPFVTLKLATSLDGRIALSDGSSRWITGAAARAHAHLERSSHELILVGRGTLAADAPRLNVRLPGLEGRSPRCVLLSRDGAAVPEGWLHVAEPAHIAGLPGDHLLIEGGAQTAAAFIAADLVDRLLLYRAPILIGRGKAALGDIGLAALTAAHGRWRLSEARALGTDMLEVYERTRAT